MNTLIKKTLLGLRQLGLKAESKFDDKFLAPDVSAPRWVGHENWLNYLVEIANKPGMNVLEIGSREVTGPSNARTAFGAAQYIGFDYYTGDNVDVVGDAHKLSSYFEAGTQFDLIYSSACFEHFAMPWIVATEIAKLLKVDGFVFVETHFAYCSHERPWHFFHYSDLALKVLFSEALGFECVDSGMSNPIVGRFSSLAAPYLKNQFVPYLYCHSEYLGKKTKQVENFSWEQANITDVVGKTEYPQPKI